MCNKAENIINENNWDAGVDKLFIAILKHLSKNKKELTKEYSVNELCDLCKEINEKRGVFKKSALNYPKNVLFSNSSGRDYIIFSEDFDVEAFTNDVNGVGEIVRRRVEEDYGKKKVYINPKYIDAVYAGKNEKVFITEFKRKYSKVKLEGKLVFGNKYGANISVDNSFSYNNKKVLIEIDSGNMAKLLVGQYFLLNELIKNDKEEKKKHGKNDDTEYIFIVVHYYKDYKPERTEKNLQLVKDTIGDSAINFRAFTQKTFMELYNGNDIKGLVNELFDNNKK
ncbi:hypothetical protein [Clostridium butyricum]|uniref:Uncharacterized protein n=1 Tax=Clostridium butyricum E4 str. BoNT E BL5262 TaxID=632245 RepID=C4IG77_CLOBU|nr:hypothetical protein [Clostridium butyricum]EDT73603.1 hypothetical protein CBY_1406 [Clostridium butyricum 5521]EEP54105.1 hypothetical protein CLP_2089 [Clostridium butyricum E4 str. BoNT E BL5262]NFL31930.1 hypothetical protein [Clostridium butyricum]NFS19383.1 hypothetical protein [Clostridium butyricum]